MDTNWAEQNIQTIRTLMERSALYRRALAPISTFVGVIGMVAAAAGWGLKIEKGTSFVIYWVAVAMVTIAGVLGMVRRQAVKDGEDFWSPPSRRVAQAMSPALCLGLLISGLFIRGFYLKDFPGGYALIIPIWAVLYGLALHAAGFFMPSGIRLFGWGFMTAGIGFMAASLVVSLDNFPAHWIMGIIFGGGHLAYGIYLYFTEPRKNET